MISFSASNKVSSTALKAKTAKVNNKVISIKPMVFGSFKKRTLMYPKAAAKPTKIAVMR